MAWPKTSSSSRGYGASWRVVREHVLRRDRWVCQCTACRAAGRITAASEVDHIVSKVVWLERYGTLEGVDDESNLQAISHECHMLKTMLDKGHKPKTMFDASGWPTTAGHHWGRKPS